MMASSVVFRDDMLQDRELKKGSDTRKLLDDQFYGVRMDDPTSYFYTWFCKHYRIKLKCAATECPICLASVTNSIELECGHAFCRSCLLESHASNFTTCALCRKEQILNPDELRKRFDHLRIKNLSKRLSGLPSSPASSILPPVPSTISSSSKPLSSLRSRGRSVDGASWNGYFPPPPSPPSVEDPLPAAAAKCFKLGEAALLDDRVSVKDAKFSKNVGAASTRELAARFAALLALGSLGGGSDVGELSTHTVHQRWTETQQEPSSLALGSSVGAVPTAGLKRRLRHATSDSIRPAPPTRRQHLEEVFVDELGLGDVPPSVLQYRWNDARGGPEESIGAIPINSLTQRWIELKEEADSGALKSEGLQQRWKAITPANNDIGDVAIDQLHSRWSELQAGMEGETVGDSSSKSLTERWIALKEKERGVKDTGAVGIEGLQRRWKAITTANGVGDLAIDQLHSRWSELQAGMEGETVGCLEHTFLLQRFQDAMYTALKAAFE